MPTLLLHSYYLVLHAFAVRTSYIKSFRVTLSTKLRDLPITVHPDGYDT
jgi:hypothetical protein